MSKPRPPSTDTSAESTDAFAPAEAIQPLEPVSEIDRMSGTQVGDDLIKDPIIINR